MHLVGEENTVEIVFHPESLLREVTCADTGHHDRIGVAQQVNPETVPQIPQHLQFVERKTRDEAFQGIVDRPAVDRPAGLVSDVVVELFRRNLSLFELQEDTRLSVWVEQVGRFGVPDFPERPDTGFPVQIDQYTTHVENEILDGAFFGLRLDIHR